MLFLEFLTCQFSLAYSENLPDCVVGSGIRYSFPWTLAVFVSKTTAVHPGAPATDSAPRVSASTMRSLMVVFPTVFFGNGRGNEYATLWWEQRRSM